MYILKSPPAPVRHVTSYFEVLRIYRAIAAYHMDSHKLKLYLRLE